MNPLVIAVPVVVVLALVLLVAAARRRDTDEATGLLSRETLKRDRGEPAVLAGATRITGREVERSVEVERRGGGAELATVGAADLAPYVPPDPDTLGVTRRQFFNRSIVLLMGLGLSGFGAAVLAFLWPQPKGGFGSKIRVGNVADIKAAVDANDGFYYVAEGRMWITNYPEAAIDKAKAVYPQPVLNSMEAGLAVLYQKCPHLGCRVPDCKTSQWFECPCHGSQYNQAGEKKGGPAPRGMDRFVTEVTGGVLTVDTGTVIQGPPIGTNTTGQEAEGPHCVTGGGGGH
ncbi:QcrA and Rieske domain-containing protein [Rhabdothermincola sediminis]|uniref:QcrA and Rieske domain-containing protein n=1 Tax=Rhabdothermincola sediminis TaxID=2751370 RepID=UPI001AA05AA3|nr:Rieske 2Fe-2S domain-containing protein [Rhabdothermincola sediminis]